MDRSSSAHAPSGPSGALRWGARSLAWTKRLPHDQRTLRYGCSIRVADVEPAFSYVERRNGTLRGWHRRFCLWMRLGRGTPERPGLMLALDRGGTTLGVAFRLARVRSVRSSCWCGGERCLPALPCAMGHPRHRRRSGPCHCAGVNREHDQYVARIDEGEAVEHIATAQGL